jgi:hypothetical protein
MDWVGDNIGGCTVSRQSGITPGSKAAPPGMYVGVTSFPGIIAP